MRDDVQELLPSLFNTYFALNSDSKGQIHLSILFPGVRNFHNWQICHLKAQALDIYKEIQMFHQKFRDVEEAGEVGGAGDRATTPIEVGSSPVVSEEEETEEEQQESSIGSVIVVAQRTSSPQAQIAEASPRRLRSGSVLEIALYPKRKKARHM